MNHDQKIDFLTRPGGERIAYRVLAGEMPTVFFLSGFLSDMSGTKVQALATHCRETGRAFVSFDYRGHGLSSGDLLDCGIGEWLDDALAVFDAFAGDNAIVVGSSMGGWIGARLLQARGERIAGFLGLASAPDFDGAMRAALTPEQLKTIQRKGYCEIASPYGSSTISRRLLESAADQHVLNGRIAFAGPVRLHHGLEDREVEWQRSVALAGVIDSKDLEVRLVGGGDHRLSDPAGQRRLCSTVDDLVRLARNYQGK